MALALGLAVAAAMASPGHAHQQTGMVTIRGHVTNGTEGGDPVEGLSVVLHRNTIDDLNESRTTVGPDGSFVFSDIRYDAETAYGVSTVYKGALYGLNLDLSQGDPQDVQISIFEPIRSDDVLHATLVSMLIDNADPVSQSLSVLEIVRLVNDSDMTYVPGPDPMQLIRFGLPEEAHGLRVDTSMLVSDIFQVDRGFGVSASVPPGTHEVLYSYQFPYSGSSFDFSRNLRYGADLLRVVLPRQVAGLTDASIGKPDAVDIGGQPYNVLEVADVPRGEILSFAFTDLPVPTLRDRAANALESIRWELTAPVALGVLAAVAVGAVLWRNRRLRPVALPRGRMPPDEREVVISMVAELDSRHRKGDLQEEEYRRRRSVLTKRLSSLAEERADPDR